MIVFYMYYILFTYFNIFFVTLTAVGDIILITYTGVYIELTIG
jgi:hypothetical protein